MEKATKEFDKLNKKIDYLTDKVIDKLNEISRAMKKGVAEEPNLDEGVQSIRITSNKDK